MVPAGLGLRVGALPAAWVDEGLRPALVARDTTVSGRENLAKQVCSGWKTVRNAASVPSCMIIAASQATTIMAYGFRVHSSRPWFLLAEVPISNAICIASSMGSPWLLLLLLLLLFFLNSFYIV